MSKLALQGPGYVAAVRGPVGLAKKITLLPLVAAFYMAATIGSAVNHALGRGVAWKGREYQGTGG